MQKKSSTDKSQAPESALAKTAEKAATGKVSPIGEGEISDEAVKLTQCEAIIRQNERGAFATGAALFAINAEKLYKIVGFDSFSEYCKTKWGISDKYAYRLMGAAECLEVLTNHEAEGEWVLPRNEAQIRPLVPLGENHWVSAWGKVMKKFAGKQFTAEDVEALVQPAAHSKKSGKTKLTQTIKGKLEKVGSFVAKALKSLPADETIPAEHVRKILVEIQTLIGGKK